MLKKCFLWVFMIGWIGIQAQDVHFSQFYYNYHNLSPALIGHFDGDHRLTVNYRNQWLSVPVPYMTVSFLYDTKIQLPNSSGQINLGIGFDYDKAGDSRLNMSKLVPNIGYSKTFSKRHLVNIAISPSVAQRRFGNEKLRWDVQWIGDRFDPKVSSRETYSTSGDFFLDLGAGGLYEFALTRRTRFMINGNIFHINKPNQSFYSSNGTKSLLPFRYSGSSQFNVGIGGFLDLILGANYQSQADYKEMVGSGLIRIYLNRTPGQVLNVLLGCNLRVDDAIIPNFGLEWKNWLISGSYDMNTSAFKSATNKRGGPELAVQYVFKGVKPIGIYKKCPIY